MLHLFVDCEWLLNLLLVNPNDEVLAGSFHMLRACYFALHGLEVPLGIHIGKRLDTIAHMALLQLWKHSRIEICILLSELEVALPALCRLIEVERRVIGSVLCL